MKDVGIDMSELQQLVDLYRAALRREYVTKTTLADAKNDLELLKAQLIADAYESGEIEGKNAETRSRAEAIFLANSQAYLQADARLVPAENEAAEAEFVRKAVEADISLIRAWLYSQSGTGV